MDRPASDLSPQRGGGRKTLRLFSTGKIFRAGLPWGRLMPFVVRDSAIFSTGAGPYPSWLRTEQEYENFVLRFEYQTEGWYEGVFSFMLHSMVLLQSWDSKSICVMNKRPMAFARQGHL